MLAVYLDHKGMGVNDEVHDVVPDRSLSANMDAVESAELLQLRPEARIAQLD